MTVTPAAISSVQLVPTSVIAGANSTFYVYLNGPAGPSGSSISLSSSHASEASVPATLTIMAGGTNGKATVTTYGLNGQGGVNITATLNGVSKSAALSLNPAGLASILAEPDYRIGGLSGANIYVYLSGDAGPSGTAVKLSGNNSAVAKVPASVTVPANTTSTYASLTTTTVGMNVPVAVTGQIGSATSIYTTLVVESALGSPWPKFHGNTQNTGVGLGSGAVGTGTWSVTSGGDNACDPVIGTSNDVYFCDGGLLYAVSPSGSTLWTLDIGSTVYGLAVGSNGSIYVASASGLYSVAKGGTVNWNVAGANCDGAPAIGQDGNIYYGSVNGNFYSVSAAGGVNWVYSADALFGAGHTFSSPAIGSDGTVYVGTSNSGADTFNLLALSSTGTLKWSYTLDDGVGSSPAIGPDGTVYVGCIDDNLYAISSTGTLKWTFATGASIEASPAIGATGNIYVGSDDDNLYAISPAGVELWSYTAGGPVGSPSIASDGTLYVQSTDGYLYAISSAGAKNWSYYSGATAGQYPTPAIALNGTIYLGVGESLFAIN